MQGSFATEDIKTIDSLLLKHALYGVVQAAGQWCRTISTVLEEIDFQISAACLAYKQTQDGLCLLIICIHDITNVGNKNMIEDTATKLKKHFPIKEVQNLDDYIGMQII